MTAFFPDCDVLRGVPVDTVQQLVGLMAVAIDGFESISHRMLYHSCRDGHNAAAFHAHCDGQGATLTVIQDTDGNVFGGYTTKPWKSHCITMSKKDPAAFLFRVASPHGGPPVLFPSTANFMSVTSNARYGPWFCHGIVVSYDDDCYTYVDGMEYSNSTRLRWDETMTGSWKFTPAIIQVYGC